MCQRCDDLAVEKLQVLIVKLCHAVCKRQGWGMGHAALGCLMAATAINRGSGKVTHDELVELLKEMADFDNADEMIIDEKPEPRETRHDN